MKNRFYIAVRTFASIFTTAFLLNGLAACSEEFVESENKPTEEAIYMSTSVRINHNVRATTTPVPPEDIVSTIRLIIFDSASGGVLYNMKHDVTDFTGQPDGSTTVWHTPFRITPGRRDFFFVANEESWANLSQNLAAITNRSQFYTDPNFTQLEYLPDYKPSQNKPILMTQAYFNMDIKASRNGKGTKDNPQHFEAEGDEVVELIRTLAKVRLTVKNIAEVENSSTGLKAKRLKFRNFNNFKSLKLVQVPKYFSLFVNPYFKTLTYLPAKKTTQDFYGANYIRENIIEADAANDVTNNVETYTKTSVDNVNSNSSVSPTTSYVTPVTTRFDYTTEFYVPENIRAIGTAAEEKPAQDLSAKAMTFGFYSTEGNLVYKASIDHGAGLPTINWEATAHATSNTTKFVLPDAQTSFSRYSVVRNNIYNIVAEEKFPSLHLRFSVRPWTDVQHYSYLGPYFNVYIEDPSFASPTAKVRIITSSDTHRIPNDFSVKVKCLIGTPTELVHTNREYQAYSQTVFNLGTTPTVGQNVFEIYYKDELIKTIQKQTP